MSARLPEPIDPERQARAEAQRARDLARNARRAAAAAHLRMARSDVLQALPVARDCAPSVALQLLLPAIEQLVNAATEVLALGPRLDGIQRGQARGLTCDVTRDGQRCGRPAPSVHTLTVGGVPLLQMAMCEECYPAAAVLLDRTERRI